MALAELVTQTFRVKEASGLYLTKVRVYFASKSTTAPVTLQIRPLLEDGRPSRTKYLCHKTLLPSQVTAATGTTNKAILSQGTDFEFDNPQFLSKGKYAICLKSHQESPDYDVYVGTIGEKQLGSNDTFISQQPAAGRFYRRQAGFGIEPANNTDLAYKLFVAKFQRAGNAILENINIPPVALSKNPLNSQDGTSTISVMLRGHGLRDGDKVTIRGIDSATSFGNGLTGADVNGVRTVVDYDNAGFTYAAGATASKTKWFGGNAVTSTRNVNYEILRPQIDIINPMNTDMTMSFKGTTQQSLAGDETRFTKDSKYITIENKKNNKFNTARAVYNRRTEQLAGAGKLGGKRSASLQVTLKSTSDFVSPMIDLQRAKLNLVHNLISKQDSASTDGFNVPLRYVGERNPFGTGTESAKHLTQVVTLGEEANGLKVLLAANRPPQADFQLYYRVAGDGDPISNNVWTLAPPENELQADTNPETFREYRYLIGGPNGLLLPFTQFQLKLVMRSTSSAHVPTFSDLRAIALI